jgi:hypothetical protein
VLVGLEVVIWNEATGRIGAGPPTVIVNTASLWVMLLTVVVLRRPVGLRPVGGHRLELSGIALAMFAAALYGAFILVSARAVSAARGGMDDVLCILGRAEHAVAVHLQLTPVPAGRSGKRVAVPAQRPRPRVALAATRTDQDNRHVRMTGEARENHRQRLLPCAASYSWQPRPH